MFAAATDESAFFATNDTVPALVGRMNYQDTMSGDSVTYSKVDIDLVGNRLNKQQVMNLYKLLFFTCVVPFNAE